MNNSIKKFFALLAMAAAPGLFAQDIVMTGGSADFSFFYESSAQTWHTVFRNKGTTVATGLPASTFGGFSGIVGLGDDYVFDTLTVVINTTQTTDVGGTDFFMATASGSPFNPTNQTADIGVRTRLQENFGSGVVQQFTSFELTLNLAESTFNGSPLNTTGSPEVGLFHWGTFEEVIPMINTESGVLTASFPNYDHYHRNWGFSEFGTYDLVFGINGVDGVYGASAPTGSFGVTFAVIPEPSTLALVALAGIGGLIGSKKFKRKND
jgi:hypothetical protein